MLKYVLAGLVVLATLVISDVQAIKIEQGALRGSFDTTLSAGLAWRVQSRDPGLVGIANGGAQSSVNSDDGNLNYGKGIFSSAAKVTHELELTYRNIAGFMRAFYFYDFENENRSRDRTPLSDEALDLVGSDFRILDAYLAGRFEPGGRPLSLRLGDQVISWGESTFIQNGIGIINPVDVSRIRTPGAELREALVPLTLVWGSWAATDTLSVEGFYQLDWENVEPDPVGSYFGTTDFLAEGGRNFYLGSGRVPDILPPGTGAGEIPRIGAVIPRSADRTPDDGGQFGVAVRWFVPWLGQTELGFFYLNYHSRLPILSFRTGTRDGLAAGDYAASARYFAEFPEDIQLFGASFNTDLANTGIAMQGEVSHRRDVPLQVDATELVSTLRSPALSELGQLSQVDGAEYDTDVRGFRRFNMTQAQVTGSRVFGPTLGASQWLLMAEVGATWVHDAPDQSDGFGDDFSMGYHVVARFDYNNVIGAINMSPRIAFAHDIEGTTPSPIGNFLEDSKTLTVAVEGTYLNRWSADISYTRFFGAEEFNLIHDRDFISVNVKWSK